MATCLCNLSPCQLHVISPVVWAKDDATTEHERPIEWEQLLKLWRAPPTLKTAIGKAVPFGEVVIKRFHHLKDFGTVVQAHALEKYAEIFFISTGWKPCSFFV